MASIRITRFAGLLPQVAPKFLQNDQAQIAHNCLLFDGWLRPMPAWVVDQQLSQSPLSLYKFSPNASGYDYDGNYTNALQNFSEPFVDIQPIGINNQGILGTYQPQGFGSTVLLGLPAPIATSFAASITPGNLSVYPITRTYAITFSIAGQESAPYVFPQIGASGNLFEGDNVSLTFNLNVAALSPYANPSAVSVNLYRTVPGFDTAEQLGNPLETAFHLVSSTAGVSSTMTLFDYPDPTPPADPLTRQLGDLLISDQFMPPQSATSRRSLFFGQTESGWAVNVRYSGVAAGAPPHVIEFSERYLYYAWPPQNKLFIPERISGMGIYYDKVFVGTGSNAYVVSVGMGDADALNLDPRPFLDTYACVAGTMVGTNFGAMYAAKDGLVALSVEGDTMATKKIASPGDVLNTGVFTFHFYDAVQAGWWNGFYIGITPHGAYMYNQPNPVSNEFPLGQLVTLDVPAGIAGPNVTTGTGFYAAWGTTIYKLPLPGYGYENAAKQSYRWKSKRYVMPGTTNFAGAKVVNDNSGTLQFTINYYNVGGESSPSFSYTRPLSHSKPFRLPHQGAPIEFDIQVEGTSVVQEIHVATSFRELTENP